MQKLTLFRYCSILLIVLLAACASLSAEPTPTATQAPTFTFTITTAPSLTPTVSTPTPLPLPPTLTPTSVPRVSSPPDGLRMAYVIDGNLYFQEGSRPALQLTQRKEYRHPIGFSDNGEKIFFFAGNMNDLYSIQVDGTNEQALGTRDLLNSTNSISQDPTTFCEPTLVPRSPFVIFRTCSYPDQNTIIYEDDLFLVDTDTGQARILLPRGSGAGQRVPSPDGKKLAVDHSNYIDILAIDGRMIKHKLATYTVSEPWKIAPLVFWTADSDELILGLPINTFYDSSPPPAYEVWRYSVDTGAGTQIHLDPLPSGLYPVRVAPDGNWLLYKNYDERPTYLVDLRGGSAGPYTPDEATEPCEWSPDSVHFLYGSYQPDSSGLYLGSVDGPPVFVGQGECVGWLDADRFVYYSFNDKGYSLYDINGESIPILVGEDIWNLRAYGNIVFYLSPGK
jgi:hypothetical protein